MIRSFTYNYDVDNTTGEKWRMHDRGSFESDGEVLTITDGWASTETVRIENCILEFSARAPKDAAQVQIWAGFRHYSRDYRYVAALRGGNNNHVYLARLGAEGYDKMLALRPLEWTPMPGVWYRMRIVCSGTAIAVYVNNFEKPLLCVQDEDAPFKNGGISLGGSYLPTQFKDVRITEIDDHYLDGVEREADYLESVVFPAAEKEQQRLRERAAYRPFVVPAVFAERQELSLDGNWLFMPDYETSDTPVEVNYDDSAAHVMAVPASWIPLQAWLEGESMREMNKGMNDNYLVEEMTRCRNQTFDYERTAFAWYRHYLDLPKGICDKRVVLDFEGIALVSTVYFNGVRVSDNIGMFAPVQIDVSGHVREGRNIIAVRVHRCLPDETAQTLKDGGVENNYVAAWDILDDGGKDSEPVSEWEHREFCTDDIPHGFYSNHPGGIWRSVHLIISDRLHVDECFFVPAPDGASVEVKYSNGGPTEREAELFYSLVHKTTGEELCSGSVEKRALPAGESRTVHFSTPRVSPRLWGPGTPNLYRLTLSLMHDGDVIDTYCETVGFRTAAFEGQTLFYNGSPMWVRGGNHMPAHVKPNDRQLARKFMSLALAHNCMATRTHVAPWTSVWLDAADEAGVMVSFEGTWTWLMLEHIPSRQSIAVWKAELAKLLKRHRNRPSLFLMTMNNEMKFYLHEAPDEVVEEKGRILEGGMKLVREILPHLPVVCDSAYYRKHTLRTGRYERIIQARGYDDGDMDDPHGYFGWYNPCFFHFMNGEFGEEYTIEGRPCMSQECATGYPRAEDGLPVRFYLYQHQTPQTTVGKKAYEYCDPSYFQERQSMLTKELAETFRRVEHDRTCGVLLFAFETWFYHQHDSLRIQPMLSACRLKLAYQPVLASAELWGRHFFAGDMLNTDITLINDSNRKETLLAPEVRVSVMADGEELAGTVLLFDTLRYFETMVRTLSLRLPENPAKDRTEAKLVMKVFDNGRFISENEYDILIGSRKWGMGNGPAEICCFADDAETKALSEHYRIPVQACSSPAELPDPAAGSGKRLIVSRQVSEEEAVGIYKFAAAGGTVVLLGQKELPQALTGGQKIPFTEHRQEIVTMNVPESEVFDGMEPLDLSWFGDGRHIPYAALGRYSVDRFSREICVLAETLEWHGYISKPTDYKEFGGTPLFSMKIGKGNLVVSALRTDAVGFDPVASRLTGNLIGWEII